MKIEKKREGTTLVLYLSGRLDTNTAPQLEQEIRTRLEGITELVFQMEELVYISSAGLRVLLGAQKIMNAQGRMRVCCVGEGVMDVFNITGFTDILTIEEMQEEPPRILCIEAATKHLDQVLAFIDQHLEENECPPHIQRQINVAAEEIFVNIAQYAYESKIGNADIQVEVEQEPLQVVITFMDQGVPYDPLQREDPDLTLSSDERPIGGLGIFLTRRSMDDVCYEYREGKNILTIKKKLFDGK